MARRAGGRGAVGTRERQPAAAAPDLQQHDLTAAAAEAVVAACTVAPGDRVLEVGPGTGALTARLLARGASVHAIEIDPARVSALERDFAAEIARGALILVRGDALVATPRMTAPWRVVANPPFQITAELLWRWLLDPPGAPPARIDLVLQLQAARKLCGEPRAESRSSALLRLAGAPHIVHRLERTAVTPPSRVDLCHFACPRTSYACEPAELRRIDRLLAIAFAGPHTVAQALRGRATATQLKRQAAEQGWRTDEHPRMLAPRAWRALADILARCGQL